MRNRWRGLLSRHSRVLTAGVALYWLAMFLATHLPMPQVKTAPTHTDKIVHLVMYAGFAFLLAMWLASRNVPTPRSKWLVLGAAVLYAGLDELLQIPLESRSADGWDFAMDLLGAALGLLLFAAVRSRLEWLWERDEPAA